MQVLKLDKSSRAFLTRTLITVDNGKEIHTSFQCDLDGNRLPLGARGLPVYRDQFTAKSFVCVAEVIPSKTDDPTAVATALAIRALKPIHYVDEATGDPKGWFIEAPDFNEREGK